MNRRSPAGILLRVSCIFVTNIAKTGQQGEDLLISEHGGECRNLPDYHIGTSGG